MYISLYQEFDFFFNRTFERKITNRKPNELKRKINDEYTVSSVRQWK